MADLCVLLPGLVGHADPHVRWRVHRLIGRDFARVASRFGCALLERDVPTGHVDTSRPRTTAVFAATPNVPWQAFDAAVRLSAMQLHGALAASI